MAALLLAGELPVGVWQSEVYATEQMQQPGGYEAGQIQQPGIYEAEQMQQPGGYEAGQIQQPGGYEAGQRQQPGVYEAEQTQQTGTGSEGIVTGSIRDTETADSAHILGRPMTPEEEAAERRGLEQYISALKEFDPGPVAPRLDRGRNPIVQSSELPIAYDSRMHGLSTPVKNQSPYGVCWAFTATHMAEASMIHQGLSALEETDLSEYHLAYYTYRSVTDPLKGTEGDENYRSTVNEILNGGSNIGRAKNTLAMWIGAVPEYVAEYSSAPMELPRTENAAYGHNAAILKNAMEVNIRDRDAAKQALLDYGSLGIMYYSTTSPTYYSASTASQYISDGSMGVNHAVTVIGWDDTFSKNNFGSTKPGGDGAWLIKNSWGPNYGHQGYFWLSYEDATIYPTAYTFEMVSPDTYDHNYQYDGAGVDDGSELTVMNSLEVANVFTAAGNPEGREVLKAVAFDIDSANTDYSIQIYKDPVGEDPTSGQAMLDRPIEGTTSHAGYYTVDLSREVILEQGDRFAVVIRYAKSGGSISAVMEYETDGSTAWIGEGQSFLKARNGWTDMYWIGMGYYNLRIKAFTVDAEAEDPTERKPVTGIRMTETAGTVKAGESLRLEASAVPADADNPKILWSSLSEETASVDATGLVQGLRQGDAQILAETEDGGFQAVFSLRVEEDPVITAVRTESVTAKEAVLVIDAHDGEAGEITDWKMELVSGAGEPEIEQGEEDGEFHIFGLQPASEYIFRAVVEDQGGNTAAHEVRFTTPKAAGAVITGLQGSSAVDPDTGNTYRYSIVSVEGAEYRMDEGEWQLEPVFTGILPESSHRFSIRMKETGETEAGPVFVSDTVFFPEILRPAPQQAEQPVSSLPAGSYKGGQQIRLSTQTEGAEILYTLDGSDPDENSLRYDGPIRLETSAVLKAVAVREGMEPSTLLIVEYVILEEEPIDPPADPEEPEDPPVGPEEPVDPGMEQVKAPVFTLPQGTYASDLRIEIHTETDGAEIYYTIDGSRPDRSSLRYEEPLRIRRRTLIRAAAFKEGMEDSEIETVSYVLDRAFPFSDVVPNGAWKHLSVKYVWDNSIMNGITNTTLFQPDRSLSRAMFATVLYRMAGEPEITFEEHFTDVVPGQWYSNAICWAYTMGIVNGKGDGSYGINLDISRQEIAKMLYLYAEVMKYDNSRKTDLSEYTDSEEVSGWAAEYMKWAVAVEMISGKPNDDGITRRLDPTGFATRAECAAMLMRFETQYLPAESSSSGQ